MNFSYGFLIGLGVFVTREYLRLKEPKRSNLQPKEEPIKSPGKRKKLTLAKELQQRLRKNNKPNEIASYRECEIKIYNLFRRKAYKIANWDNRTLPNVYPTIRAAKNAIGGLYPPLSTRQDYFAEKEKELRRKEEVSLLAKAYEQRIKNPLSGSKLAQVDDLFNLSPVEFEKWVRKHIFEKENWQVSETKKTGDGGIDLILWKNDEKSIAQCKRFRGTVGQPQLRDFYGTMMSEGVSRGFFVTTGLFSLSAIKFAENKPIGMIDRRVLAQKYV